MTYRGDLRSRNRILEAELAVARAQLDAQELEKVEIRPEWAERLTITEWRLVGLLVGAFPRAVCSYALEENLPRQDHARERETKTLSVYVCKIRSKLGRAAIETVRAEGFRAGPQLAQLFRGAA
jgi:DNA-binding response OmpR family regulator